MEKHPPHETGDEAGESTTPLDGVTITPSGDVVIGAPTAISIAKPPEEDD
jgi:hypothetical protein